MAVKVYRHSVTGREISVSDDSRLSRLVKADKSWSEVKSERPASRRSRKTSDEK